jgi:hypothetical protein
MGLLHALEAGDQFLGEIFFGLGPEQSAGGPGIFFNLGGEFDKLLHVAADVVLGFGGEIDFFMQEGCIESEIDLNVAGLFGGAVLEFQAVRREANERGLKNPFFAGLGRSPEIPVGFEDVGVIVVEKFDDLGNRLLGCDARTVAALEDGGLAPGDGLDGGVGYAAARRRKRDLAKYADGARENLGLIEAGEPEAQIKRVGHVCILNRRGRQRVARVELGRLGGGF